MSHYFFALSLPEEVKHSLQKVSEHIRNEFPFKNWVHHEDYHITLAFLGHAELLQLDDAVERTRNALRGFRAFPLHIHSAGVFGNNKAPRILWAGTERSAALQQLQQLTYESCTAAGFELEKRPFKPHITLARKWTGDHPFMQEGLKKHVESILPVPQFIAEEAVVYQTHLDRIPKYEKIQTFKLLS